MTARVHLEGAWVELRPRPWSRRVVLSDLELVVEPGVRLAVIGPSGGGKTTLGRLVAGLVTPSRGRAHVDGRPAPAADGVAWLPQDPTALLHPAVPIGLQVAESAALSGRPVAAARDALAAMELGDRWDALPGQLSGGEQRRAMFARIAVRTPRLVVADEITTGLDAHRRASVLTRLPGLADRSATVLLITHDLDLVPTWCDRYVVVADGRIVDRGAADTLTTSDHPWTRRLRGEVDGSADRGGPPTDAT